MHQSGVPEVRRLGLAHLTNWIKRGILYPPGGWLSPGGLHGLQNRLKGAAEAALVGSTPIHSRRAMPLHAADPCYTIKATACYGCEI